MAWGAIIGGIVSGVAGHNSSKKAGGMDKKMRRLLAMQFNFHKGIWDEYKTKYGPLEDKMISEVSKGLDPVVFADKAQTDIATAYDRAKGMGERRLTRYGVDPTEGKYQRALGRMDLDEAKSVAGGRNKARQWVNDTNFGRRLSLMNYGGGLRASALAGLNGASNNMANYFGNQSKLYGTAAAGLTQSAVENLSNADYSSLFSSDDDQEYADGGVVDNRVTRAGDTIKARMQYKKYNTDAQTSGETPLTWEEWLAQRGRSLDDQQLVKQNYADGGQVGNIIDNDSGRVIDGPPGVDQVPAVIDGQTPARLTQNEFVVPADVVMHKGVEHFEKEIKQSRASRGLDRRIH